MVYATFIPLIGIKEWIEEKIGHDIVRMRAHWEVADNEDAHEHTHIIFEVKDSLDLEGQHRLDFGDPPQHPNVKSIRYESHFRNAWEYVWKCHANPDLEFFEFGTLIENDERKRAELNELRSVIQRYNSWSGVVNDPTITVAVARHHKICYEWWLARPHEEQNAIAEDELQPWQKEIIDETSQGTQIVNSRTATLDNTMGVRPERREWQEQSLPIPDENVCFNLISRQAKTTFITRNGKSADIAHAYEGQRLVVFDIPRSQQETLNYGILESLKDGYVFSSKYNSTMKRFPIPHVYVLSNSLPKMGSLSRERLKITVLNVEHVPQEDVQLAQYWNIEMH